MPPIQHRTDIPVPFMAVCDSCGAYDFVTHCSSWIHNNAEHPDFTELYCSNCFIGGA